MPLININSMMRTDPDYLPVVSNNVRHKGTTMHDAKTMTPANELMFSGPPLSAEDFEHFRQFLLKHSGIDLTPHKRALVQSRLGVRLRTLECNSFAEYWAILCRPESFDEREHAVNLLSTNETYFFREYQQFDWLHQHVRQIAQERLAPVRIWSAACSTGEEAYTIAITLAEALGINLPWYIYATDINTSCIRHAKRAVYSIERAEKTPPTLWHKYFQHGHDEYTGQIRVKPALSKRVQFENLNLLNCGITAQRDFDVIYLRNVLIYFNEETKLRIIKQLCSKLVAGGHLLIGQAEVIQYRRFPLVQEAASRYRYEPLRRNSLETS